MEMLRRPLPRNMRHIRTVFISSDNKTHVVATAVDADPGEIDVPTRVVEDNHDEIVGSYPCNDVMVPPTVTPLDACDDVQHTGGEVSSIFAYPNREHDSDGGDEQDTPPPPRATIHDSDGDDEHAPPPPPRAEVSHETREMKASRDRLYARSKKHLLCNYPVNPSCEGCLSKSRNKSHYRGAFLKSTKDHGNYITMDQLSVTDLHSSPGIGGLNRLSYLCALTQDIGSSVLSKLYSFMSRTITPECSAG